MNFKYYPAWKGCERWEGEDGAFSDKWPYIVLSGSKKQYNIETLCNQYLASFIKQQLDIYYYKSQKRILINIVMPTRDISKLFKRHSVPSKYLSTWNIPRSPSLRCTKAKMILINIATSKRDISKLWNFIKATQSFQISLDLRQTLR